MGEHWINTKARMKSESEAAVWNAVELAVGHALALRCIRVGIRAHEFATGVAVYRERIIALLEVNGVDARVIAAIRNGELA